MVFEDQISEDPVAKILYIMQNKNRKTINVFVASLPVGADFSGCFAAA